MSFGGPGQNAASGGSGFRAGRLFRPTVTVLLALHLVGFLAFVLTPEGAAGALLQVLGLVPAKVFARAHVWQLVTHSMLYPDPSQAFSLIWTALMLLFMGSRMEGEWGTARFAVFCIVCTAAAGVVRMLPAPGNAVLHGSLGFLCALLGAYAWMFRHQRAWVLFTSVRMPHFVIGLLVILALMNIRSPENMLWLSGAVFGFLYARIALQLQRRAPQTRTPEPDRFSRIDV